MHIVRIVLNIVVVLAIIAATLIGVFIYKFMQIQKKPDNHPRAYIEAKGDRPRGFTVVCAGDSITHGHLSADYLAMLRDMYATIQYDFINAGINGDLAYHLLQRCDDIIACRPDMVTILIGTNDATATFSDEFAQVAKKTKKLPEEPSLELFEKYLTDCVTRLKQETEAHIVIFSIPPIGEDPSHPIYAHSERVGKIIKRVAQEQGIDYLPLWENMDRGITQRLQNEAVSFDRWKRVMYTSIVQHTLFGVSYETIARTNGFIYHTDHLHLNRAGARIVADMIERNIAALKRRTAKP